MLDVEPTIRLRAVFNRLAAQARPDDTVLQSVLMVGAFNVKRNGKQYLYGSDRHYLENVARTLPSLGFRLAADVGIKICNLKHGVEHDFLKYQVRADLVIFSYVYYRPELINQTLERYPEKEIVAGWDKGQFQSNLALQDGVWHEALLKTGAKMAVNIVSTEEEYRAELPNHLIASSTYVEKAKITRMSKKLFLDMEQDYHFLVRSPAPIIAPT